MGRLQLEALNVQYRPQRIVRIADRFVRDETCRYYEEGRIELFLFRYTAEQYSGAREQAYWTACETLIPEVASTATGIFVGECMWRATWRLSVDRAGEILNFGPNRFSSVGVFSDIQNLIEIKDGELVWERMES